MCVRNFEKRLMNGSIDRYKERFRTRGFSQKEGENYDGNCSSKPEIPLSEPLYLLQYPWSNLKVLRYTRKRPLYTDEEHLVWIKTTWCGASHVQQKHGENFL
jgi:hypothetical protein